MMEQTEGTQLESVEARVQNHSVLNSRELTHRDLMLLCFFDFNHLREIEVS